MGEWGDGSIAESAEDATKIWMAVKKAEKFEELLSGNDFNSKCAIKPTSSQDNELDFDNNIGNKGKSFEFWSKMKIHESMLRGAILGFALGLLVTSKVEEGGRPW